MEIARSNMFNMLNWFYQIKRTHLSHDLLLDSIEESMLKDLIDFIIGPNDLLRDEVKNIIMYYFSLSIIYIILHIIKILLNYY